eukprot:gene7939-9432_t
MDNTVECFTRRYWYFTSLSTGVVGLYVLGLPLVILAVTRYLYQLKAVCRKDTGAVVYIHERDLLVHNNQTEHSSMMERTLSIGEVDTWHVNPLSADSDEDTVTDHTGKQYYFFDHSVWYGTEVEVTPIYIDPERCTMDTAHSDPSRMLVWGRYVLPFKRNLHYWAAYDMLRKLAQTSFVFLIRMLHADYGLLYSGIITATALAVHAHCHPYDSEMVNFFQTGVLLSQSLIVILLIGERYERQDTGSTVVGLLMISTQGVLFGFVMFQLCIQLRTQDSEIFEKFPLLTKRITSHIASQMNSIRRKSFRFPSKQ